MLNIGSPEKKNKVVLKLYHGYGHKHDMVIYGHLFKKRAAANQLYSKNVFKNLKYLLKLFSLKAYPAIDITLTFGEQQVHAKSEFDGFFKLEWAAVEDVSAGLHRVQVVATDQKGVVIAKCYGKVYVPHITQYGVISDIDDTVMVSHSSKIVRRLRELVVRNPRTRKTFKGVVEHYRLLAYAKTTREQPNPFFYVSSSEWNLYDYLKETFRYNNLPEGAFLLNSIKKLKSFFKTGKTGHEGKLLRVMRILKVFPNQKFIFFGDNSQMDPIIYATIAEKYSQNMAAVYIRNVRKSKMQETEDILHKIRAKHIPVCFFKSSNVAIEHSKKIGLID